MNVQSFCWNVLEIFFENQRELQAQFEKSKQIELHERFTFRRMIRCNDSTLRRITSYETARGNLLVYSLRTLYFSRGARGKYAYLREFFFLIFFFCFSYLQLHHRRYCFTRARDRVIELIPLDTFAIVECLSLADIAIKC